MEPAELFKASCTLLDEGQVSEALSIWMKWLVLPSQYSDFHSFHLLPSYFETILRALHLSSDHSNLQKFCLAILRTSIARLQENVDTSCFHFVYHEKETYLRDYEGYCSIFETIVMGRYANQVQECMAQLSGLNRVHQDWWFALYSSALRVNNEQIRKIMGSWLLDDLCVTSFTSRFGSRSYPALCSFLDHFLKWAMQGQLLYRNIHRDERVTKCDHGDALAAFARLLTRDSDAHAEWLLNWVSDHAHGLNQHATAYILQGWVASEKVDISRESFCAASQIAKVVKFSPFPKLLVRRHCLTIMSRIPQTGTRYALMLRDLQDEVVDSMDPINGEAGAIFVTSNQNDHTQAETSARVWERLSSRGYVDVSDSGTIVVRWDHLLRYDPQQALWRLLAESWPHWVEKMLADSNSRSAGSDLAAGCVGHFINISRNKTFVWRTTASSLRRLYLTNVLDILHHPQVGKALLRFINDPPSPAPEYLLDAALADSEKDAEGNAMYVIEADESHGHACIFDMLSRLRAEDRSWGQRFLDTLLHPWLNQKEPIPIVSKWKKLSQLQAMVILVHATIQSPEDAEKYWSPFLRLLGNDPNPHFRFPLEWIIIRLCQVDASFNSKGGYLGEIIDMLEGADPTNPNPKLIASFITIAIQLIFHLTTVSSANALVPEIERLLSVMVALAGSPRIPIRFEAQASFPAIYEHVVGRAGYESITNNRAYASMNKFVTGLEKYKHLPQARILSTFDCSKDMNLATLFEGGYIYVPQAQTPLLSAKDLQEVVEWDSPDLISRRPTSCLPIGEIDDTVKAMIVSIKNKPATVAAVTTLTPPASGPFQTKSFTLNLSSLSLDKSPNPNQEGTGPILIGSLVEAAINLGGLSRAANVFGCHSLHIPKLDLLQNPHFKSLSLHSELHMPIVATPATALLQYLQIMKKGGWSIVGLEQTDSSIIIGIPDVSGDRKLPKKAIIVMGAEKTGIPADVLMECDLCVEIKQWGVTRSLNVQTAAAVILCEWRKEWGSGT